MKVRLFGEKKQALCDLKEHLQFYEADTWIGYQIEDQGEIVFEETFSRRNYKHKQIYSEGNITIKNNNQL